MSDTTPGSDWDRRGRRHGEGSWMVGVILILLGLAFFLERLGVIAFVGNWWSIFIYLAALASFVNAWRSSRSGWGAQAGSSLTWGLVLTVVASIFLFNLAWDMWWPAIVIAVGIGIVVSSLLRGGWRSGS